LPDIIYVCGDSHTAGGELVDDLLWPDQHPGFFAETEIDLRDQRQLSRWREFRDRSLRNTKPVGMSEWQQLEKEQAWPARLAKLTGIETTSRALMGASMEWITRQCLDDVSLLLQQHSIDNIMVVVQPTSRHRCQYHDSQLGWSNYSQAIGGHGDMYRLLGEHETDTSLMTRWLNSIIGLCGAMQSLGVRLTLVNSSMPDIEQSLDKHPEVAHLRGLYDRVKQNCWHGRSMGDLAATLSKPRCPDLHWTRDVHQLLAEDIAAKL